jgi:alkylation response protein AidB-like acyl-CoA dehydrogenase
MDVRYSPEQQALADSAAQMVDRLGPTTVASLDDGARSAKLAAAVEAAGWLELRVDHQGGPLASGVEAAIVAEELGRGLADVAFLGPTLAAELRRLRGAPAAGGETVLVDASLAGLAVVAGIGGPAPDAVAIDARGASRALLLVAGDDGGSLATVDLPGDEGRRDAADSGPDLTRAVVRADPAVRVARVEGSSPSSTALTRDELTRWTALGLALTAADLVGVMRGAIHASVEYASARRQFERPIGSFQAVQHLLADALVLMEGSRSAARHAAWAVDALAPADALAAAAVAKAYSARAARTVCETAIQVHGGIGNTWECLAHVFLRRALLSSEVLGGVGPSLDLVLAHQGIGAGHGLR